MLRSPAFLEAFHLLPTALITLKLIIIIVIIFCLFDYCQNSGPYFVKSNRIGPFARRLFLSRSPCLCASLCVASDCARLHACMQFSVRPQGLARMAIPLEASARALCSHRCESVAAAAAVASRDKVLRSSAIRARKLQHLNNVSPRPFDCAYRETRSRPPPRGRGSG